MTEVTKKAIQKAYLKLVDRKAADKITVKDIARECGINRNTFYYHYQDIYSLVEDIVREQTDILVSRYPARDTVRASVDYALQKGIKHRSTFLHFYGSSNRAIFEEYLWKMCERFVDAYVRKDSAEDRSYFIRFQTCFLFGLLIDWFNKGMPEQFIDDLHKAFEQLSIQ